MEYYTPIQYVWTGTSSYDILASVAYAPTVFFGANTDITFATAYPFEQTIVNRVAGLQNATIRFDGQTNGNIGLGYIADPVAYDPEQPNAVVHYSHTVTGITPTLDIQASAGNLVVERRRSPGPSTSTSRPTRAILRSTTHNPGPALRTPTLSWITPGKST